MKKWLQKALRTIASVIVIAFILLLLFAVYSVGGMAGLGIGIMSIITLLGLIVLTAFILANHKVIFVRIESNHLCCAEIDGQFFAFFCRSEDKVEILLGFEAEASLHGVDLTSTAYKKAYDLLDNRIKTRDSEAGITGWLVEHFNLHFMTFNPFVSLRKIKVIRTHINAEDTTGDLAKLISVELEVEEEFLRIKWPRQIYVPDLELKHNVQILLVATNTEFTVIDPYQIFYKNQDISRWADFQMKAALINHLGGMEFAVFEAENFTATNPDFTKAIAQKGGFGRLGLSATGKFAIVDWDLAGSQAEMKAQQQRKAAASAKSDADIEEARGTVTVIKQTGEAKAVAARMLRQSLQGDPSTALVLATENLSKGNNTVILGGSVLPTVNVGNNPTTKGTP